jgi:hypothetical protein
MKRGDERESDMDGLISSPEVDISNIKEWRNDVEKEQCISKIIFLEKEVNRTLDLLTIAETRCKEYEAELQSFKSLRKEKNNPNHLKESHSDFNNRLSDTMKTRFTSKDTSSLRNRSVDELLMRDNQLTQEILALSTALASAREEAIRIQKEYSEKLAQEHLNNTNLNRELIILKQDLNKPMTPQYQQFMVSLKYLID